LRNRSLVRPAAMPPWPSMRRVRPATSMWQALIANAGPSCASACVSSRRSVQRHDDQVRAGDRRAPLGGCLGDRPCSRRQIGLRLHRRRGQDDRQATNSKYRPHRRSPSRSTRLWRPGLEIDCGARVFRPGRRRRGRGLKTPAPHSEPPSPRTPEPRPRDHAKHNHCRERPSRYASR
jgi:hypothetical protein